MADLIDRQEAIEIVRHRCKRCTTEAVLAITEIEQLPSAQPQRKKGKCVEVDQHMVICPFCKHASSRKNFCAECGADMRGENDE